MLLLVHHGYFWRGEEPVITGMKRQRISKLLNHNINLFAYHLPLDCHPEFGNNACLAKLFECGFGANASEQVIQRIFFGQVNYLKPMSMQNLLSF